MTFRVIVPASTSNLGSGFDTLSAALALYLTIDVETTEGDGIEWMSGWDLPPEENIVVTALEKAMDAFEVRRRGVRLSMKNPIPLKRGLGSSGAAIISGIKIGEALSGRKADEEEVLNMAYALEGHPDNIAASLLGGWALSRVDKGKMRAERIPARLGCRFVVVVPEVAVSTRDARNILPSQYTRAEAIYNLQRCALFVHALYGGRPELLRDATGDRLHQRFRAGLVPGATELLDLRELTPRIEKHLLSVTISGSGSAMIAMADAAYEEIGQWMVDRLRSHGTESAFLVLDLDKSGARVMPR